MTTATLIKKNLIGVGSLTVLEVQPLKVIFEAGAWLQAGRCGAGAESATSCR